MSEDRQSLRAVDWTLATWDGARREQLRRWAGLPLERIIMALEEMADLAEQFEHTAKREPRLA